MNNWFLILLNNLLFLSLLIITSTAGLSIGINDDVHIHDDVVVGVIDDQMAAEQHHASVDEVPAAVKQIIPNYHGDTVSVDGSRPDIQQAEKIDSDLMSSGELKRARRSKQNLCEHLCTCNLDSKFVTVNCSFLMDKDYILGAHYVIPNTTRSLRFSLADKTILRLDDGFFKSNNVNSIHFIGLVGTGGQIEITKNAFSQNFAVYPEIKVNRCSKLILKDFAFRGEFTLNVTNCRDVFITRNAFHNTTFNAVFDDIGHLGLFEGAFADSRDSKVTISNAKMEELGEIGASMKMFKIVNSTVGTIVRRAFSVVSIDSLVFENSKIDVIEGGSVAEKLFCKYLAVISCKIDRIQSQSIDGSGIMSFEFNNNQIKTIEPHAFYGTAINTTISGNNIISVGHKWLAIRDWSNIHITDNTFGEFSAIEVGKTANPGACTFGHNFITSPTKGSLKFNHTACRFYEISFYKQCGCSLNWLKDLTPMDLRNEVYCQVDNTLKHCFNSTTFNVKRFIQEVCDPKTKTLDCMKNMNVKKVEGNFISPEEIRKNTTKYILIAAIGISALLCVLVLLVIYFACKRCCSKKEDQETYLLRTPTIKRGHSQTFSDDDQKIIFNTLDTMKLSESHALYSRVYQYTKKLLDGCQDEVEKVICIGEILRALNECESTQADYVGFTAVLNKQLRPTPEAPPEYEVEDTIRPQMPIPEQIVPRNHHNHPEHIYAEPVCLRKPLLNNDYSLPLDRDNEEPLPVYSEPIRKFHKPETMQSNKMATPYAIGNATGTEIPSNSQEQQHQHQQNLPDILYQSVGQNNKNDPTNVAKITPTRV